MLEIEPCDADQVTARFEVLLMRAENCAVPPEATEAVTGVTLTATFATSATMICKDCCLECPLESDAVMAKLKLPEALGVPATLPAEASAMPPGNWPEATEKV